MNARYEPSWHFVDAKNMVPGRIATTIAELLVGKHKPTYNPRHDEGDYVVVVNSSKIQFTGRKKSDKLYYWHTGHPGGIKSVTPKKLEEKGEATEILRKAVSGMLPKNKLRKHREKRLVLFPDVDTHGLFDDVLPAEKMATPVMYHKEFAGSELETHEDDDAEGEWEDIPAIPKEELQAWIDANPDDADVAELMSALSELGGGDAKKKKN